MHKVHLFLYGNLDLSVMVIISGIKIMGIEKRVVLWNILYFPLKLQVAYRKKSSWDG
jgi:hypothetical protein